MNICKKIISTICASVFTFSCFGFNVGAKVIEPEIVKTETWTTSYFIDDDMNTLYPYIQCEADIYNDGTIKLYMWNTHEWDGFATVSHYVNVYCPFFNADDSYENNYNYNSFGSALSYYDKEYSIGYGGSWNYKHDNQEWAIRRYYYYGPLSKLSFYNTKEDIKYDDYVIRMSFTPKEDPTGTYNFRLFGHDITITPELLSGNIVAEPELTEQEKYIKQLEEENSKLKTEIESYKKLDFDGDGLLTNADAQMILVYYTNSLVGKTTGKVEDYGEYIKLISN